MARRPVALLSNTVLFALISLLLCGVSLSQQAQAAQGTESGAQLKQAQAPNVIVYLVDDLGVADVQQHPEYFPHGSPLFETPNIHRLATEGMRFSHVYAQPLCSASRAALLSGQDLAARIGLWSAIVPGSKPRASTQDKSSPSRAFAYPTDLDHLPLAIETIAERLKMAGYATWHVGKWHLAPDTRGSNSENPEAFYPSQQGFDQQLGVGGAGPDSYFGPFDSIPGLVDHHGLPAVGSEGDFLPEHTAALVQGLVESHVAKESGQPFFLYYAPFLVHFPQQARRSDFNEYQTKLEGLPQSKHQHPVFAAQVAAADAQLGALLTLLDNNGLTDNTLLIFLSDNGGQSIESGSGTLVDDIGADGIPDGGANAVSDATWSETDSPIPSDRRMSNMAPFRAGKGSLFEGGIRVPMLVRYRQGNIPAGSLSDVPVHLIDIFPTILDYTPATEPVNQTMDGLSLKPILSHEDSIEERDIFIHFPRSTTTWGTRFLSSGVPDPDGYTRRLYPGGTAMVRYPFKMIARYSTAHDARTIDYQLYRLDIDMAEQHNIAAAYPERVDAMRLRLHRYYQSTGALLPLQNLNYSN